MKALEAIDFNFISRVSIEDVMEVSESIYFDKPHKYKADHYLWPWKVTKTTDAGWHNKNIYGDYQKYDYYYRNPERFFEKDGKLFFKHRVTIHLRNKDYVTLFLDKLELENIVDIIDRKGLEVIWER